MTSIKIGYSLSLTGAFEAYGNSILIAHKIWESNINKRGGLLGRRVELLCVDDQSNPVLVADIYKKLIEEDKVDLIIGGYGSSCVFSAVTVALEHEKFFLSLMAKGIDGRSSFSMLPVGSTSNTNLSDYFFKTLAKNNTLAIVSADAEFTKSTILGARENASKYSQRILFEHNYPLSTHDFTGLAQELKELKPDAILINAYSSDAIGVIKAINELGLHPKRIGVSLIGPLGLKNFCDGVERVMEEYLSNTNSIEADMLGYYLAPQAYAQLQVLEQAVIATNSLNDFKLAGLTSEAVFRTVLGDIKFDRKGECCAPQMQQVQFQNVVGHESMERAL